MQTGSLAMVSRKDRPAVWQFRWSEKGLHGSRVQRKRVIGTVECYRDEAAARAAVAVLLQQLNSEKLRMGSRSITVAQLCDHFEQRELVNGNAWRSYSTKKTCLAYLTRNQYCSGPISIFSIWRRYDVVRRDSLQACEEI